MEFLDYDGLVAFEEELSKKYLSKKALATDGYATVIYPQNMNEKFNDNQIYLGFTLGNEDKNIDLYFNRDNDFNDTHTGIKAYHFMDGLGCPTDKLKGDYSDVYAKNFICIQNGKQLKIGTDSIEATLDTTNFYNKSEIDSNIESLSNAMDETLEDYPKFDDLAEVATSGSYADLLNKPSIPTKTSDLVNDSGFTTDNTTYTLTKEENVIKLIGSDGSITMVGDSGSTFDQNDYYTKTQVDNMINSLTLQIQQLQNDLSIYTNPVQQ